MFDLTLKEEEKDSYIVDVVMNDDGTYTVSFASGRKETYPFNIHNFQVELYRMEEQFLKFMDTFDDVLTRDNIFGHFSASAFIVNKENLSIFT